MENGPFIDDLLIEPDDCPWLMWLSIAMVIYRKALDVFTPSDPFWDNRDNPRIQDLSDYRNFVYSIIWDPVATATQLQGPTWACQAGQI